MGSQADHAYAKWVVGYVHLNHEIEQLDYEFSSHGLYTGERRAAWVNVEMALRPFVDIAGYRDYMTANAEKILAVKSARRAAGPRRERTARHGVGSHVAR